MADFLNDPKPHGKPILCLDFDGVIHSYKSGWKGVDVIPDPPVPGAFAWIELALHDFDIYIYSSRSESIKGRFAMQHFFIDNGAEELLDKLTFTDKKPRAFLTIDDRCVCFNGRWSDPEFNPKNLLEFTSWYKYQK